MKRPLASGVSLRPWATDDLPLLERLLGDPAMTEHLGGPESPDAIRSRHERYLAADPARNGIYAITLGPEATPVGWIGYWEADWNDETVWECGWHVLPEYQGRGIARQAAVLMIGRVRDHGVHRYLHAFPAVDNIWSNALCRTLGFDLRGEVEVEYPRGSMMRAYDWRLDLAELDVLPGSSEREVE